MHFFAATICRFSSRTGHFAALALLGVLLIGAGACSDTVWRGQVAMVNGSPITLDQVAALRNSTYFDWNSPSMGELDVMRRQYGDALTTLLAVELVKQHLVKKKFAVTPEEVLTEERLIRADYPAGVFEEVLVSEAIDLETWRFLLHNHLSVQRFLEKILRPDIVISPEEVNAYLQKYPTGFTRPPWAYFFLISGPEAADVTACAKDLDAAGDPVLVQDRHPGAVIRTVRLDINRLDPELGRIVKDMRPGDLSPVFTIGGEPAQVLLLEILPERRAEPGEVYLQIEETLLSQKMQDAYTAWIRNRMQKATIKVSEQLLPHLHSSATPMRAAP